jgi:hypothetical protein
LFSQEGDKEGMLCPCPEACLCLPGMGLLSPGRAWTLRRGSTTAKGLGVVPHACNPSYLGGGDSEVPSSRPVQATV